MTIAVTKIKKTSSKVLKGFKDNDIMPPRSYCDYDGSLECISARLKIQKCSHIHAVTFTIFSLVSMAEFSLYSKSDDERFGKSLWTIKSATVSFFLDL